MDILLGFKKKSYHFFTQILTSEQSFRNSITLIQYNANPQKRFSACLIPLLINLLSLCQMKSMSHPNNTSFLLILFIDKTVNVRISIQVYRAAKFWAKERKERNSFPPPISVRRETMQFDRKPATRKNTSWEMIGANHALFSDIYGTPENWGGLEYLLHTDCVNYRC